MAITRINGTALRIIRERTGLSLRGFATQLADAGCPISPSHLSRIENGADGRQPGDELRAAMAKVLKVPLIELIGDEGPASEAA